MPTRPSKPCAEPGCNALVLGVPRCPQHARKPWTRRTPWRRPGTSGWSWQRTRARILQRDGHRCRYCGAPADVVDHVLNVARGGTDDDRNLAACCRSCNEAKRREEARLPWGAVRKFGVGAMRDRRGSDTHAQPD